MAAKNGRADLRNTADNLDKTGLVVDTTPVEEWCAFACTSVRALIEAAATCEAGDHGTVQVAPPTTPATQRKGRKVRAPRAVLPLALHMGSRTSSRNTLNACLAYPRGASSDATPPNDAHARDGQAAESDALGAHEPPYTPERGAGSAAGSVLASTSNLVPPSEASQRGAGDHPRLERRAIAARVVARMRAIDAWVRLGSGLRTSAAAAATEPAWLALAGATLAATPTVVPAPPAPLPAPLPAPPARSGGRQRWLARRRRQRQHIEAEEDLDMLQEVVCNGVLTVVAEGEYYLLQAAGQLQGPEATAPFRPDTMMLR